MEDARPRRVERLRRGAGNSERMRLFALNLQDEILELGERVVDIVNPGISFLIVEMCRDGESERVGLVPDVELRPPPRFHQRFREVLERLRVVLEWDEERRMKVPATCSAAPHEGQTLHLREKLAVL